MLVLYTVGLFGLRFLTGIVYLFIFLFKRYRLVKKSLPFWTKVSLLDIT